MSVDCCAYPGLLVRDAGGRPVENRLPHDVARVGNRAPFAGGLKPHVATFRRFAGAPQEQQTRSPACTFFVQYPEPPARETRIRRSEYHAEPPAGAHGQQRAQDDTPPRQPRHPARRTASRQPRPSRDSGESRTRNQAASRDCAPSHTPSHAEQGSPQPQAANPSQPPCQLLEPRTALFRLQNHQPASAPRAPGVLGCSVLHNRRSVLSSGVRGLLHLPSSVRSRVHSHGQPCRSNMQLRLLC